MKRSPAPLVVNGWSIFAHPLFLDQLDALMAQVEKARARDPGTYLQKNAAKRLAAIARLAFDLIPQDPTRAEYRLGDTLGPDHRHWFRAKFFQQHRLFFRYSAAARVIIYAWVNDEHTKRAYESGSDAYRVFQRMIARGHPPDDWSALLAEATAQAGRLRGSLGRLKGK